MRIDETNIANHNHVRPPVENEVFLNGVTEVELSRRVFYLLYAKLITDKIMIWTGENPMSEIKYFYYPFSNCKITVIE